jgi:phosphatidylglycerol:prolipoprotein diacylglycerol transferase
VLPELFHIPFIGWPIHTYGLMMVTGFLLAMSISTRYATRLGNMANDVLDYGFWGLVGGIAGARIVFILVDWRSYFVEHPFVEIGHTGVTIPAVFAIWQGGLVYWGSFLGGLVALGIFARARKLNVAAFLDICVLGVPLAQAIGRIGCIAAGCCWGRPMYHIDNVGNAIADVPLAMRFPPGSLAYGSMREGAGTELLQLMNKLGTTPPLFPWQFAEAIGTMAIFFALLYAMPRKWFHGQIALMYASLYAILRGVLEIYRGDVARGFVIEGMLSTSQFISILVVAVSCIVFVWLMWARQRKAHEVA